MPMLVLMEEAYPWIAVFSPYRNVHVGIVPIARETDPDPAGGGATLDGGMMGYLVGILPVAKPILRRSSPRDFVSASGYGTSERGTPSPSTRRWWWLC
jgi:hypothetical protein